MTARVSSLGADHPAPGRGVAQWRQIADTLQADIAGGALGPGAQLPTEARLAARFGVNRHTVRRALEELSFFSREARVLGVYRRSPFRQPLGAD